MLQYRIVRALGNWGCTTSIATESVDGRPKTTTNPYGLDIVDYFPSYSSQYFEWESNVAPTTNYQAHLALKYNSNIFQ